MVEMAGQRIRCRIGGEQTGGALSVLEVTLGPGLLGAPPHMHRKEDEVLIVIEGEMMVQVGERVVRAVPGEFVFKPRGVTHTFWNPGATTARFLEFITPSGYEGFFGELAPLFPADEPPDLRAAVELARRYEIDFDLSRVPEILKEHSVQAAWLDGASLPADHARDGFQFTAGRWLGSYDGEAARLRAQSLGAD
jgi:mannose-6-phosphate isomerase-like protein (cupin superfamily)